MGNKKKYKKATWKENMHSSSIHPTECCTSVDWLYLFQPSVRRKSASDIGCTRGGTRMSKENIFALPNIISDLTLFVNDFYILGLT